MPPYGPIWQWTIIVLNAEIEFLSGLLFKEHILTYKTFNNLRPSRGLLLSADILAADYNSHVQKGGIGPSNRPSTCFLQDLLL